jgi:hypothetical protein
LIDNDEGKKKEVRLKSYIEFTDKLEGNTLLSDSEITQKSRDSILLIGDRVHVSIVSHYRHRLVFNIFGQKMS